MAENGRTISLKEEEGEEHEEGEISDEEPPPALSSGSEEQGESARVEDNEAVDPAAVANTPASSDPDAHPLHRRAGLDELIDVGSSELKASDARKRGEVPRGRGRELDSSSKEDDGGGNSLKRNGWGAYGSNLYNFAWAQAVSGRQSFNSGADSPSIDSTIGDGLLSTGSGGLGVWSTESHRKLSRTFSRDSEVHGRSTGRSSEEKDDMSPLRENNGSSRAGERGSSERGADSTGRGRRSREASWSEREKPWAAAERPQGTLRSRIGRGGGLAEENDYHRDLIDGDDARWRKQRSESPNGKLDEADMGAALLCENGDASNGDVKNGEADDKEEGELEEGEIELGSQPAEKPASPTPPDSSRQSSKYGGVKAVDYWAKDKPYGRSLSSKSLPRPQIEDYSSRRQYRQLKPHESQRVKRLSLAGDLVKNVTVKDAQKSFVDVCGRLHKALRVLDELHTPRQGVTEEGRAESLPREITTLARQAFAGIRAVYAVRNTASGREQERDKNIFPRLLELANGYCQKLFTPKQTRELEVMMQTIANAGRLSRDGAEKGQYPREHQFQPAPKKTNEKNGKPGEVLGSNVGNIKLSSSMEPKSSSENSIAGRILGFVDAKQAEEAAAIAAAALAYAQSSAAARASSLFGSAYDSRPSGTPPAQGSGTWGWLSDKTSQFTNPGMNSLQPNNNGYNPSIGKYQARNGTDQRPMKLGQDGYASHFMETKARDTPTPGSTHLPGAREGLITPSGYFKAANTFGMLEDDWEELSPPGAGMSSFGTLPAASGQPVGINEESSQGKVWPSRPELGTVPPYINSRGTAPQYSAEHLSNPNQQRNLANTHMYSIERLPSPTPDEDDDSAVAPGPPSLETKPGLLDLDIKNSSAISQPQGIVNLPQSMSMAGSVHNLTRSQSLDGPDPVIELKMQKDKSGEILLPLMARSSDANGAVQASLPPIFGNRDPRRRFQSLDLTRVGGLDLNSQVISASNLNQGDLLIVGHDRNRKRLAPDVDDKQDIGMQKRQKGQLDANGFNIDSLHASAGTGGWLDDNVVPLLSTDEELPTPMEVDEEGPSTTFHTVSGPLQTGDGTHRKMKARDPRRVFLDSHVERGDRSSGEILRAEGIGTVASNKAEVGSSVSATAEVANWNEKEEVLASKQGASLPNIAPHFIEKLTSIAGMVGSSSLQATKNQPLVNSGASGQVVPGAVTEMSFTTESVEVDISAVSSESSSQELQERQKDVSMGTNGGLRKLRGSPSQWGASQVHPGLEQLLGDLSDEERRSVQLERKRRMEEQDRMFSAGKLCLVLDLDHTLLNSAKFSEIEQEWDQRLRVAESAERSRTGREGLERRELYRFPHMSMWTKLRPGIWKFLARASQLYELHVYTMGNKVYATEMAKLLDPTGKLFAGRVISKGDDGDGDDLLPKSKDLDGVLGMESAVVIIDDSARVWPHHSENLIVVERYMYFPCSRRQFGLAGPSLSEVGHDERESDGMLASALRVIERIHQSFFKNPRLREVDVREILAAQQRQVLAGCKVVFSRVFPVGEAEPHRHPLWRTAEQFGAICTSAIDELVTHVVAISLGTDKVNWAVETGRYVVRPAWLEASTILYRRANEREFPVLPQ